MDPTTVSHTSGFICNSISLANEIPACRIGYCFA
jgi:hypothetical protein